MGRKVEVLKGSEITTENIDKLRQISFNRYDKAIYDSTYWGIENVSDLSCLMEVNIDDITLVFGEDWFLIYLDIDNEITFAEWVAIEDRHIGISQSIEMFRVIKEILLNNRDKKFTAEMRHDTSYQIYSLMQRRGYFSEISHKVSFTNCAGFAPERLKELEDDYSDLDTFLESEEAKEHPEYLKFILHDLDFAVTDKFVKKYSKGQKQI